MGFLSNLFGSNQSVPTYDMKAAKDLYQWTLNQGRYNVNNGFAGITWDPSTNTQNITYSPQMQSVLGNLFGGTNADKQAEQAAYNSWSDKNEPLFERQNSRLKDQLANQGIPVGSEAYSRAMSDLAQNQNEARTAAQNQAYLTGQQARNNEINNNLSIFSAFNPLNGYAGSSAQGSTNIYDNYYNGQVNQAAAEAANKSKFASGLLNLGTAAAGIASGFLTSDARIKENMQEVGRLYNGLPVYLFNFVGDPTPRLGLLAQEVEQVFPQAVAETEEGLKLVNYAAACLPTQDDNEEGEKTYE